MKGRGLSVAIALCALMLAGAGPAQARHAERTKCTARNAHTVIATETGRIFTTPLGNTAARVYGCLYSQNRRFRLGIDGDCDPGPTVEVEDFILIGRYVAFVNSVCNIDSGNDFVVVVDLRTGRQKWAARAVPEPASPPGEPSSVVTDMVMSRTGSIAWIAEYDGETDQTVDDRQVRKLEPGAPEGGTLLDSGLDIGIGSLAMSPRTRAGFSWLYWQKGTTTQTGKVN